MGGSRQENKIQRKEIETALMKKQSQRSRKENVTEGGVSIGIVGPIGNLQYTNLE